MKPSISHFNKAVFLISLDTELMWGLLHRGSKLDERLRWWLYREGKIAELLEKDVTHGRRAVDTLLELFERYNIAATWAMVGNLFREGGDPLFYGRDIVEKILLSKVKHEIGYHSLSHVLFSQCSRDVAEKEIREGLKLAKSLGLKLKSFVFPSDEIGHVDVLKENGFKIYRGPDAVRKGSNNSLLARGIWWLQSEATAIPVQPHWENGVWEIGSSMEFCEPWLPQALLFRARRGLSRAIKNKAAFHVMLHPLSLLLYHSLASQLGEFLKLVAEQRDRDQLLNLTMGELADNLDEGRK